MRRPSAFSSTSKDFAFLLQVIASRLFHAVTLLLAVVVFNFALLYLAPGDVADTIAQSMGHADEETLKSIRDEYGLDDPFFVQLFHYLKKVARLDLGYSYYYSQPVADLIFQRLPATLLLVFTAQLFALVVGMVLGVVLAQRPQKVVSHLWNALALFGYAAPVFWTGLLLVVVFSLHLQWFPVAGMRDVTFQGNGLQTLADLAWHLLLPSIALGSVFIAIYARLCRATMIEALSSDYVRAARARGLPERRIAYRHALKNAVSPVITTAGVQFSAVISGAVLVETVFAWPGLGTLAFQSILARDTTTFLGILLISACVVIAGNLVTDVVLRWRDPRQRMQP